MLLTMVVEESMDRAIEEAEIFSMRSIAGELRWIRSKDKAEQKRMLALERELEDRRVVRISGNLNRSFIKDSPIWDLGANFVVKGKVETY